jgi:energy-converting hydrogenase Eha subunit F
VKTSLNKPNKIAGLLAFVVGGLSVVAGGMAMRGWQPGYFVLNWLPVYNLVLGVLTVFIPALLIWKKHRLAWLAATGTLSIHALVLLLLLFSYADTVALQSILAMLFRLVVWIIILGLMFFDRHKK